MSEEEAIKRAKEIIKQNKQVVVEARKVGDINTMALVSSIDRESIVLETLVKEIETQQKELDKNTERINELINEVTLKDSELDKKDKILDLMAKTIFYTQNDNFLFGYSIEEVREYFTKKAEGR